MNTRLYIVRHGQSLGNAEKIFLGHTDLGLTELGDKQAKKTASALADIEFSAIYSSDLIRAYNTALPSASLRDMDIIPDKRFRELYCGEWEGMSIDELISKYGAMFTESWVKDFGIFRMPGGESIPECAERMYEGCLDAARSHPGTNILIATHAAAIRALYGKICGINPENLGAELAYPSNASYSIIEFDGSSFTPIAFSVDGHLEGMLTTWRDE